MPLLPVQAFLSCLKRYKGLPVLSVILSMWSFHLKSSWIIIFIPRTLCCRNSLKLNRIMVDLMGEFSGRKNVACLLTWIFFIVLSHFLNMQRNIWNVNMFSLVFWKRDLTEVQYHYFCCNLPAHSNWYLRGLLQGLVIQPVGTNQDYQLTLEWYCTELSTG